MRPDIDGLVVHAEQAIERLREGEVGSVIGEDILVILEVFREGMVIEQAVIILELRGGEGRRNGALLEGGSEGVVTILELVASFHGDSGRNPKAGKANTEMGWKKKSSRISESRAFVACPPPPARQNTSIPKREKTPRNAF